MYDDPPRPPDPFENYDVLREVADDRDVLLRAHGIEFPRKGQKTTHARSSRVKLLRQILQNPNLAVSFHVAKALQFLAKDTNAANDVGELARSFWRKKSPRDDPQAEWPNFRAHVQKTPLADPGSPRYVQFVAGVAAHIHANGEWWAKRLSELFGSAHSFPPPWPKQIVEVEQLLDGVPDPPPWFSEYLKSFRAGMSFEPETWRTLLRLIADDRLLNRRLGEYVAIIYPRHVRRKATATGKLETVKPGNSDDCLQTALLRLQEIAITNSDGWFSRHAEVLDNPAPKTRSRRAQLRRSKSPATSAPTAKKSPTWRGFLLASYETVMKREAEYDRRPKGSAKGKSVLSLTRSARDDDDAAKPVEVAGSRDLSPDDAAARKESVAAVRRAVSKLAPDEQVVIYFRFTDNMSPSEIAVATNKGESDVEATWARAREKLALELQGYC